MKNILVILCFLLEYGSKGYSQQFDSTTESLITALTVPDSSIVNILIKARSDNHEWFKRKLELISLQKEYTLDTFLLNHFQRFRDEDGHIPEAAKDSNFTKEVYKYWEFRSNIEENFLNDSFSIVMSWKDVEREFFPKFFKKYCTSNDTLKEAMWYLYSQRPGRLDSIIRRMIVDHGNPKLSWKTTWVLECNDSLRADYFVSSNTMRLISYKNYAKVYSAEISQFIAELSHAEQYRKDQTEVEKVVHKRIKKKAKKDKISYYAAHDFEYSIPGSIEYAAHKEIQPKLLAEFLYYVYNGVK